MYNIANERFVGRECVRAFANRVRDVPGVFRVQNHTHTHRTPNDGGGFLTTDHRM